MSRPSFPSVLIDTTTSLGDVLGDLYNLPSQPPSLYLDLEGFNLCRNGRLSLITIFASPLKTTYVIDVQVLGDQAFNTPSADDPALTLKTLLEDNNRPKVLFDCRNDADALWNLYQVDMKGVVDLQLLELACRPYDRRRVAGLGKTIRLFAGLTFVQMQRWNSIKDTGAVQFNSNATRNAFEDRPLNKIILEYSVQDVVHLPKLFTVFDAKLTPAWRRRIEVETEARLQLAHLRYLRDDRETKIRGPAGW